MLYVLGRSIWRAKRPSLLAGTINYIIPALAAPNYVTYFEGIFIVRLFNEEVSQNHHIADKGVISAVY